jgi:hypothetical protein
MHPDEVKKLKGEYVETLAGLSDLEDESDRLDNEMVSLHKKMAAEKKKSGTFGTDEGKRLSKLLSGTMEKMDKNDEKLRVAQQNMNRIETKLGMERKNWLKKEVKVRIHLNAMTA